MLATMRKLPLTLLIATCVLGLAACETKTNDEAGDGETGTAGGDGDGDQGDGDGDNEAQSGDCGEETVTVLEDLAQVPPGFSVSPADMIAALEGNFAGTFSWGPADGGWTNTHADMTSPLTAAITHNGGEVRLIEVELLGQPPMGDGGPNLCSNRLSVDVELEFATEDGVFAETLAVAMGVLADPGDTWGFGWDIDFDQNGGTLDLADFMANDGDITALVLSGQASPAGLTGELGMEVTSGMGPDGVVGFGLIAEYDAARQ
jgi:hypothetical protein